MKRGGPKDPNLQGQTVPLQTCSGPFPTQEKAERYRDAQKRALALLGELGYPVCMGLMNDADRLARELTVQLKTMRSCLRRGNA